MDGDGGDLAEFGKTSRERPKSVPYLRLKIAKGLQSAKYSLLQYPHEEKVGKIPFFRSFFHFFFVSDKSHSAEKCRKGHQKSLINLDLKCQ